MPAIELNLISGRTIQQGVSMEHGKEKHAYTLACGIVELDPEDFKALGIYVNTNVRLKNEFGEIVVKAVEAEQGPNPGLCWVPMGPWANMVTNPRTYSMGLPTFKGVPVTIEPAPEEKVLDSIELIEAVCL